jgi:hypothetical protein
MIFNFELSLLASVRELDHEAAGNVFTDLVELDFGNCRVLAFAGFAWAQSRLYVMPV